MQRSVSDFFPDVRMSHYTAFNYDSSIKILSTRKNVQNIILIINNFNHKYIHKLVIKIINFFLKIRAGNLFFS